MKKRITAFITLVTVLLGAASAVLAATATPGTINICWLYGTVWENSSLDEKFDEGTDKYISGITVNVLDASTKAVKQTAVTDQDGKYSFELEPGEYVIQFTVPDKYKYYDMKNYNSVTDMSEYTEILSEGTAEYDYLGTANTVTNLDTMLRKMSDVWLDGYVWYDANSNAIRPAYAEYEEANGEGEDEAPIAGAVITVTNADGEKVADGETDETGKYGFEVPAGMNTVAVTFMPENFAGYGFTTPDNGTITREFSGNDEVFIDFGVNEGATVLPPLYNPAPSTTPTPEPDDDDDDIYPTATPKVNPAPTATPEAEETPKPETTPTPVPQDVPTLNKTEHYAYVVGYEDGKIKPENNITRQEVATIFFRLLTDASRDYFYSDDNTFTDVSQSLWSNIAISTMAKAKIVNGYNAATFMPLNNITRAEFATIAAKFDSSTYVGPDKFTDISGHWAAEYINRAAEKGWISGYTDGTFNPDAYITRAEAMTLINNVLDRHVTAENMLPDMTVWPDNTPDKWYYTPVQEATNSHYYEKAGGEINEVWTTLRETRNWAELERKK